MCSVPQNKQERRRAYNVTMRHVYETIMAVEKQSGLDIFVLVRACVCARARAPVGLTSMQGACALLYYHLCPV